VVVEELLEGEEVSVCDLFDSHYSNNWYLDCHIFPVPLLCILWVRYIKWTLNGQVMLSISLHAWSPDLFYIFQWNLLFRDCGRNDYFVHIMKTLSQRILETFWDL
jgi:hypothetical protein